MLSQTRWPLYKRRPKDVNSNLQALTKKLSSSSDKIFHQEFLKLYFLIQATPSYASKTSSISHQNQPSQQKGVPEPLEPPNYYIAKESPKYTKFKHSLKFDLLFTKSPKKKVTQKNKKNYGLWLYLPKKMNPLNRKHCPVLIKRLLDLEHKMTTLWTKQASLKP